RIDARRCQIAGGRPWRISAVLENSGVYVGSIDVKPEEQGSKQLLATAFAPVYVPSAERGCGYLLIFRDGNVLAYAFDEERLAVVGDPVTVVQNVGAYVASGFFLRLGSAFGVSLDCRTSRCASAMVGPGRNVCRHSRTAERYSRTDSCTRWEAGRRRAERCRRPDRRHLDLGYDTCQLRSIDVRPSPRRVPSLVARRKPERLRVQSRGTLESVSEAVRRVDGG